MHRLSNSRIGRAAADVAGQGAVDEQGLAVEMRDTAPLVGEGLDADFDRILGKWLTFLGQIDGAPLWSL